MNNFLTVMAGVLALAIILLVGWDGLAVLGVVPLLSWLAISQLRKHTSEKDFVTKVFVAALLVRLAFGLFVHVYDLRGFFGGDSLTYDGRGNAFADYLLGDPTALNDARLGSAFSMEGSGWGMTFIVGILYSIFGRNIFLAQSIFAFFGALTSGLVYFCAGEIFANKNVSRLSALLAAFFPAFIIWSGQLLKDGLIVFLLVLAMLCVLELQKRLRYQTILALIAALFGVLSLRFYVFYMVAVAVIGSFVVGSSKTNQGIIRRMAIVAAIGLTLTYVGVVRIARQNVETFGSLEQVQRSRSDLATSAGSGFGEDVDVSTTQGAISAIPVGLVYLMLAPFPWEATSFRASITLPEVLLWWAMLPVILVGLWYTIRNRLRTAFPVLVFSLLLTLAYSIFQGNVGTAYRQRTQIQVFLFIFFAAGWELIKEWRENRSIVRRARMAEIKGI